MLKRWKMLPVRKRCILLGAVAVVFLLAIYAWAAARPGYWGDSYFLYETPTGWKGKVYGETLIVEKTNLPDGAVLRLHCASGETVYEVIGAPGFQESVTVRQDGRDVFSGSYHDGFLFENGDVLYGDLRFSMTTGEGTFILDENNREYPATGLDLRLTEIVELALKTEPDTRGYPWVVLFAAILLSIVFVELWAPEIMFRRTVGRYIQGDAEPSDFYEAGRIIRMIVTVGAGIILLIIGFPG